MTAIVYTSKTGHTKQYAELLSKATGLPCFDFKSAKKRLKKAAEIIYLGWVMAGNVKNAEKAAELFTVKAICAVGSSGDDEQTKRLKEAYSSVSTVFYLKGGVDMEKLSGIQRLIMNMLKKSIEKRRDNGETLKESDVDFLEQIRTGKNMVREENLQNLLVWYNSSN